MKQDNIKERKVKDFSQFKTDYKKFQESGDGNRTVSEEDITKIHPGMRKIKGERLFTKHDSNVYHAAGIPVEEDQDETSKYVKARIKNAKVLSDEEQAKVDVEQKGYDENGYIQENEKPDTEKEEEKKEKDEKTTDDEDYYQAGSGNPVGTSDGVSEKFGRIHSFETYINEEYKEEEEEEEIEVEEKEELEESKDEERDEAEIEELKDKETDEAEEEKEEELEESKKIKISDDSTIKIPRKAKSNMANNLKGGGKGKHPIKDESQLKNAKVNKKKQNLDDKEHGPRGKKTIDTVAKMKNISKKGIKPKKVSIKDQSQLKTAKINKEKQNLK